jgi:hypothetical protein
VLLDFGGPPMEPHARRLALAMAIVRLVNGATDSIQPRADGATARSVHSLAKVLHMPPILVELRHQAAHSALPRLDALVDAGHEAMAWLEAEYWQPQGEAVAEYLECGNKEARRPPRSRELVSRTKPDSALQAQEDADEAGDPSPPAHDNSPTKRRPRSRWRPSGSPSDWKGIPIGLLPGQTEIPSLIGIDVGPIIGSNWQPSVLDEPPGCAANDDAQESGGCNKKRKRTPMAVGESDSRPSVVNNEPDEAGYSCPTRKGRRSLSDVEKSRVQDMMQKLLAGSGAP